METTNVNLFQKKKRKYFFPFSVIRSTNQKPVNVVHSVSDQNPGNCCTGTTDPGTTTFPTTMVMAPYTTTTSQNLDNMVYEEAPLLTPTMILNGKSFSSIKS